MKVVSTHEFNSWYKKTTLREKARHFLNRSKWLEEGFILQSPQGGYWLGQGPFFYSLGPKPQTLYHPDFFLTKQKPWIKPSVLSHKDKKALRNFLFKGSNFSKILKEGFKNAPSFIQYQTDFCQAKQALQKGLFQKVVLAFSESFNLEPQRLLWIQKLFAKAQFSPYGFLYGAWDNRSGILGWTPEILFNFKGSQFETMALAGTGFCPGPSLLSDKKELKEHDFVAQSLSASLKAFLADGRKTTVYEVPFPPLKHLRTDFFGRLSQKFNFEKISLALHPTPALGGYPRRIAFNWLKSQPSQKQRQSFGAPFGFFDNDHSAFCLVALRALEWELNQAKIFSGVGLIKESLLQKEWRELLLKRQQVKSFFQ